MRRRRQGVPTIAWYMTGAAAEERDDDVADLGARDEQQHQRRHAEDDGGAEVGLLQRAAPSSAPHTIMCGTKPTVNERTFSAFLRERIARDR